MVSGDGAHRHEVSMVHLKGNLGGFGPERSMDV